MSSIRNDLMNLKLRRPGDDSSDSVQPNKRSKTVLEMIRENGIEPNVGCQEGFCGACRCKIKSGEVAHSEDTIAYIGDDEIIPCTATITSEEIEIELGR